MEISYATSSNVDITEGDVVTGVARQVRMVALDCSTPSSPGLPTTSLIARWRTKLLIMSAVEWMEMLLPLHLLDANLSMELGWLLRFISHSVISGFITSSAIIIALSQAKYFLGYNIERSSKIVPLAKSIIAGVGNASGPLTAVILGTSFVKMYHPSSIAVVGEIPQGFPRFHIPREFGYAESLISTAILITGVAILESVGIAKALAAKNGYELDSNQELFGLGIANICGSFFSAYPATGSFSRSAVNHESGAKTGLSGIITGITMGCALYFLTPLFQDIPQCALAAIVISVGISLVDYEEALFLWHVDKKDFLLWTISCIMTLFLGIEIGVLVGVRALLYR
ncbi:hypothetical protein HPP92_012576 [Vanilla planifolia]|uniref:SLC26A/SulP transporter domain-containing protein n=1 Tax=Vanilla planifolia TaxID=51239 RepID=A0A835V1V7_VANPL|nr:hypothetical protein HPP92_012576 [Vanilla planifolia]